VIQVGPDCTPIYQYLPRQTPTDSRIGITGSYGTARHALCIAPDSGQIARFFHRITFLGSVQTG